MPFLKVRDLLDNPILDTKFLPSLVLVSQMYQKKKATMECTNCITHSGVTFHCITSFCCKLSLISKEFQSLSLKYAYACNHMPLKYAPAHKCVSILHELNDRTERTNVLPRVSLMFL